MPSETDSWARSLHSVEDLPQPFLETFSSLFSDGPFPYVIYAPPDRWGIKSTPAKLLCLGDNKLVIFEQTGSSISSQSFKYQEITLIEKGTSLLYSWLKIQGIIGGQSTSALIEYNTVVNDLFVPVVNNLRTVTHVPSPTHKVEKTATDPFRKLRLQNLKFTNLAQESLLPGEDPVFWIFQQTIRGKVLFFFPSLISAAHMHILTDHELILIREEYNKSSKKGNYGAIWTYIPLPKISALEITADSQTPYLSLVIRLALDEEILAIFEPSNKQKLETFYTKFKH